MKNENSLLDALNTSSVFQEFKQAFSETTGLPLALRPVGSWQLPQRGNKNENPFCALMARQSRSCANCLQVQQRLTDGAHEHPATVTCGAGLCESAVPVRMDNEIIGFLQTGQAFRHEPTAAQFDHVAKQVSEWGLDLDITELKNAYFGAPVRTSKEYAATVDLLNIFAEHLSILGKQLSVQEQTAEPPVITRAKQFINDHYSDDLSLDQVAKAANMSMFYFCKQFKKATGLNFTEYLSSVRVEKAKNLLLNRELRVSEIGYEVGFQSLTHFNRVFKKLAGCSPTDYRSKLPA